MRSMRRYSCPGGRIGGVPSVILRDVSSASNLSQVPELFSAIREATKDLKDNPTIKTGRSFDDLQDRTGSQVYEVLYTGKVTVSEKKAPPTFIDIAVEQFKNHELQRERAERRRRNSSGSNAGLRSQENGIHDSQSMSKLLSRSQDDLLDGSDNFNNNGTGGLTDSTEVNPKTKIIALDNISLAGSVFGSSQDETDAQNESKPKQEKTVAKEGRVRRNRTMVLQIGSTDLCLVSPDKKSIILERRFKDISFCSQGIKHPDYFGFISREPSTGRFLCYVFQCATEGVVESIMTTLKQSFHNAFQQSAKNNIVCERCPMHQLHKLCLEVEGMAPEKIFDVIQARIDQLGEKEQAEIVTRFKEENPQSYEEMNEVLMSSLRQICEARQQEHVHISAYNEEKSKTSEFHLMDNAKKTASIFDSLKTKAKKSLALSFENLLKAGSKKEKFPHFRQRSFTSESLASHAYDPSTSPSGKRSPGIPSPKRSPSTEGNPILDTIVNESRRPRSSTIGSTLDDNQLKALQHSRLLEIKTEQKQDKPVAQKSPPRSRKSMFIQASALPDGSHMSSGSTSPLLSPGSGCTTPAEHHTPPETPTGHDAAETNQVTPAAGEARRRRQSYRMGIFNKVVTPARHSRRESHSITDDLLENDPWHPPEGRRFSCKEDIHMLWKKAIQDTILLIRMEKENHTLQARQDAVQAKRVKLDYHEITPCLKDVTKQWDEMLHTPNREKTLFEYHRLKECICKGVPRTRRGDVWELMIEQHKLHNPSVGDPNVELAIPYHELLKQLTTQQHAILIDLGRTFPSHPYFAAQLGPGQLALFNLLKAYSLLDQEVGYCQGLSFVAGILLMHMGEDSAFEAMKYVMFNLGFRKQYRPDMTSLQIQMYQLSRLIHDRHKDLYDHFETNEIVPTLYAAPWFLTLFASQFPLGFVARVFDLLFLEGMEVIFKVALVLLGEHKELIKQCENFETVVDFLKTTLPDMSLVQMERIINEVFKMEISKQLIAYEIEYHVLQEEMVTSPQMGDSELFHKVNNLKRQNMELLEQLQNSHSINHSLESKINSMQATEHQLSSRVKTLELERTALLNTVAKLRKLIPEEILDQEDIMADLNIPYEGSGDASSGHINQSPLRTVSYHGDVRARRCQDSDDEVAKLTNQNAGLFQNGDSPKHSGYSRTVSNKF
ncbi:unnamed protein product [Owenia fusiformis]|uniref:TBC1 domain family member 4 n=1 Tax=Owenia fusiformis TaxID=6347 RepID=A0A8J1TGY5_OWEFU|nr:unnamed protein product [Owenia fusiformis]